MKKTFEHMGKIFLVVVMTLSLVILPAFAGTDDDFPFVNSPDKYKTVFGYTYRFGSLAHSTSPGWISYQTNVEVTNADTVPAGYMGVEAVLYVESDAKLKWSSGWSYNQAPTKMMFNSAHIEDADPDMYYFSQGKVLLFDGRKYVPYDSIRTPNISPMLYSLSDDRFSVQVNENGEIYGSEFFLNQIGIQPDLILAENADGIVGYVRAADLNGNVTCPEEAIAFMQSHSGVWSVPMYLSDGETVIGTFEIG